MIEELLIQAGPITVYLILFFLFLFEGPVANFIASAYAATSGFLNIWLILFLAVLGDTISDLIYFFIGYRWGPKIKNSKINFMSNVNVESYAKKKAENNLFLFMFLMKVFSITAVPGILYLGSKKTSFKKFLSYTVILVVIFQGFFSFLAYNLVISLGTFVAYKNKIDLVGTIIILGILGFLLAKFITLRVLKRKGMLMK